MDSTKPKHILDDLSIKGVVNYILKNDIKNILVLVGAGASVAAGIPDFRSPETGVYANLSQYDLDSPTDAFSLPLLRKNPKIFYSIAEEMNLWPGTFHPTAVHRFIADLAKNGRLLRCCTQNIDGLEIAAGVPSNLLVEAHGSFRTASCIDCFVKTDIDAVRKEAAGGNVPRCKECGGIVKPDVVFFGEQLPERFFDVLTHDTKEADLLMIIGTSLQVHPFAALPLQVKDSVPRILINLERVGGAMFRFPLDPPLQSLPSCNVHKSAENIELEEELNSSSSSDGYAQYSGFSDHPDIGRDIFFPGDCQETISEISKCIGFTK